MASTSSWRSGAHLEEGVVADDFALGPKFPRVADGVRYPRTGSDVHQQVDVDSGAVMFDIQWALWGDTVIPGVPGRRHRAARVSRKHD